ncbi:plasmid pRiA4b ORF-3 family protein [Hymenobacter sp. DH14]|uniref:Plasmid pRiA4b ORF-3 family protein n=1 Tax=Hymenobacter cyanobacteriorum TaxID=2926463 RepID=A0A9X2AEL7_9BACT|nr:plasmid pRiA4b ORF-3 family protein [Hymenobacter cyanobacteriorum]MCI1187356.1 plasmid pRiA4b ORF-3 family protein [Hymenobacter cyanobacteriorum]
MANLLQLKIALRYLRPPIWRRVEVPDTLTFWELHFVLQILFDWQNSHLFEFRQGRGSINDFLTGSPPVLPGDADNMPEWQLDPRETTLDEVLAKPKDKLTYVYDFGDYWEHDIVVEKVIPLAAGHPTPAVRCLTGKRAAPPEDIGGFPGYEQLLDVLAEKAVGKRKRMPAEYAGLGKFDSEEFALAEYNLDLSHLREIVAGENQMLAEYQRQMAANPPPPRPVFDPQALLEAMTAMMQARFPEPLPKPKKPKK